MPKYRNKTEFTRPVSISGKRLALKPNDVVSSDRELDLTIYDFLEMVDDSQKLSSIKELGPQKLSFVKPEEVQKVQTQVDALKNTPEDIKKVASDIETVLKRMEKIKTALETVNKDNQDLKKIVEDVSNQNVEFKKTVDTLVHIIKELETEVYDNGLFVIEDINETEKK
jgi:methyl-accepting chemotaxis protein